jgi:hypothetical protein
VELVKTIYEEFSRTGRSPLWLFLRDGLITRVEEYLNPTEALEAVGLTG